MLCACHKGIFSLSKNVKYCTYLKSNNLGGSVRSSLINELDLLKENFEWSVSVANIHVFKSINGYLNYLPYLVALLLKNSCLVLEFW